MRKILLLIGVIFIFCIGYLKASEGPLFNNVSILPLFKLSNYQCVYIDNIDTSEVNFDLWDPYPVDHHSNDYETLAEQKDNLANQARLRFSRELTKIIPVVKNNHSEGKTLSVSIKFSGTIQDESLLSGLIANQNSKNTYISFYCKIYDAEFNKEIITISDDYTQAIPTEDISTLRGSDINNWYKAMDYWASKLVQLLKNT